MRNRKEGSLSRSTRLDTVDIAQFLSERRMGANIKRSAQNIWNLTNLKAPDQAKASLRFSQERVPNLKALQADA